jgi:hypothetical protein
MRADRRNYPKLRYGLIQVDHPNRAAIPRSQVLMVAPSRNQIKARCLNEIAGFFAIEFSPKFQSRVTSGLHSGKNVLKPADMVSLCIVSITTGHFNSCLSLQHILWGTAYSASAERCRQRRSWKRPS